MEHIIAQINKIDDENINELEELYYKLKKTTSKKIIIVFILYFKEF